MITLREYQTAFLAEVSKAWHAGALRVCGVLPTGAGKTITAAAGVERVITRGRKALWVAHREELVEQAARTLEDFGLHVGVIAASSDRDFDPSAPVQVASVQTLLARGYFPRVDLLVADECHHYGDTSEEWSKLLTEHYSRTRVLGLTATPERGDGTGLGPLFDELVVGVSVAELVKLNASDPAQGLVWCDVVRPDRMLKSGELAQDPLDAWKEHAAGRPTIVFCRNVEKARELAERFNGAGVPTRCIHAKTPKDDRAFALEAFRSGLVKVLTCVYVLTEGTDLPLAEVCLLARGAGTQTIFMQMVGRVLRPAPGTGKRDALLIDLQGVSWLHRMPEDPRIFSLTGKAITVLGGPPKCPVCGALRDEGDGCASCGWQPGAARDDAPETITNDPLVKYARKRAEGPQQRRETLVRWIRAEMLKGFKPTSVFHKWRATYGVDLTRDEFTRGWQEITPDEIDAWKMKRGERSAKKRDEAVAKTKRALERAMKRGDAETFWTLAADLIELGADERIAT